MVVNFMAGKTDTRTANVAKYFDSQLADGSLKDALAKQVGPLPL
jgi:hypothetical protein